MRRVTVRRPSASLAAIALGLGVGTAVGFLLGELAGPVAERTIKRGGKSARRAGSVAELVYRAQAALADDLPLRECHLHVVPVGPGRIELHGWVHDRRARSRAAQLVADAVDADAVINCVQVRGEDDVAHAPDDESDELLA